MVGVGGDLNWGGVVGCYWRIISGIGEWMVRRK